jgi:hypothetical protein
MSLLLFGQSEKKTNLKKILRAALAGGWRGQPVQSTVYE